MNSVRLCNPAFSQRHCRGHKLLGRFFASCALGKSPACFLSKSESPSPRLLHFKPSPNFASKMSTASPSPQSFYMRPLPPELVPFNSAEGRAIFHRAMDAGGASMDGFFLLIQHLVTQVGLKRREIGYSPLTFCRRLSPVTRCSRDLLGSLDLSLNPDAFASDYDGYHVSIRNGTHSNQ